MRGIFSITILLFAANAWPQSSVAPVTTKSIAKAEYENLAKQKMAKDLVKLAQSLDLRLRQNPDAPGRPGEVNANDGNTARSNTTYHAYVESMCLEWEDKERVLCKKYLPPYVTSHKLDKSKLEGHILTSYEAKAAEGTQVSGSSIKHGIFDITMKDDSELIDPEQGKFKWDGVAGIKLQDDVLQGTEEIAYQTSATLLRSTYDEEAKRTTAVEQIAPDPEKARYASGTWTRMLRNRLVSLLGEISTTQKGVEVMQGEDLADCMAYQARVNGEAEEFRQEDRLSFQFMLDPETPVGDIEERMKRCQALKQASVYMKNPTVEGDQVKEGDPNEERVDAKLIRANLAALDYGGASAEELSSIAGMKIDESMIRQRRAEWNNGASDAKEVVETNSKTMQDFNRAVDSAAVGMKNIALRTDNVNDLSEQVKANKIPDRINLVELNGLTPGQKNELKDQNLPSLISPKVQRTPANTVESTPAELTVTSLQ